VRPKKVEEAGNYSWKTAVEAGNFNGTTDGKAEKDGLAVAARLPPLLPPEGTTDGKAEKDGLVSLSMTKGDNTTEAFGKAGKWVVKRPYQDWQTLAELEAAAGTEPGPLQSLVRRFQNFKTPAAEVTDLSTKLKEVKKEGDTYSGDLTEAGAKELLSFGRRRPNAPEPKNAKGSVKIWTKAGAFSKYEVKIQATVKFNGEDRDIDRTTTVEIKELGTTKIEVPEAAKKKLS